jgi:hypothetical protein
MVVCRFLPGMVMGADCRGRQRAVSGSGHGGAETKWGWPKPPEFPDSLRRMTILAKIDGFSCTQAWVLRLNSMFAWNLYNLRMSFTVFLYFKMVIP